MECVLKRRILFDQSAKSGPRKKAANRGPQNSDGSIVSVCKRTYSDARINQIRRISRSKCELTSVNTLDTNFEEEVIDNETKVVSKTNSRENLRRRRISSNGPSKDDSCIKTCTIHISEPIMNLLQLSRKKKSYLDP